LLYTPNNHQQLKSYKMDIEFHYYITYLIAVKAGFSPEDALTLAHASQYVDNNNTEYTIDKGLNSEFRNPISQTLDITKPQKERLEIYPVFHFIPGNRFADTAKRKDGTAHPLNTTPNSDHANAILELALESRDLLRIGIACHGYVDTWAHQNFVGCDDDFNSVKGFPETIIPNIGHADAFKRPDNPGLIWTDPRLAQDKIKNKERYLEAAQCLLQKLAFYNGKNVLEETLVELRNDINQAIGRNGDHGGDSQKSRIKRYLRLATKPEYGSTPLPKYKENKWFGDAVKREIRGEERTAGRGVSGDYDYFWKDRGNHKNTSWYKFQKAVTQHQEETLAFLEENIPEFGNASIAAKTYIITQKAS